jgi:hypothetical protein
MKGIIHLTMILEGKECLVERSVDKERSVFRKSELESFFVRKINICLLKEERIRSSVLQKRKICRKVLSLQFQTKKLFLKAYDLSMFQKRYICLKAYGSFHVSKKKDLSAGKEKL